MMRSIVNCSSGRSSIATSVLVVVPRVRAGSRGGVGPVGPPETNRRADAGYCPVDVQHAGRDAQKKQHDDPPGSRAEPAIDRPPQPRRDANRDHQFDANSEAEANTLLQG